MRWAECAWERLCSSLARRNGESAGRPANERISAIALGERVKPDYRRAARTSRALGGASDSLSTLPMRLTTSAIFAASAST